MAHPEQQAFCLKVKARFPERFHDARVLDVGSLDINGSNRGLFADSEYLGIDLGPGNNVDLVCHAKNFEPGHTFDVVISTEALEHDFLWKHTLRAMRRLCQPSGLILITCGTAGRPEHGTAVAHPNVAPFTNDHYGNIVEANIREVWDCGEMFSDFRFEVDAQAHDLYFWGITQD